MTEAVQEKKEKKVRAKKKTVRQVAQGNAYIQASYNNTIVTITDLEGNVLGWSSAGVVGFKGSEESNALCRVTRG